MKKRTISFLVFFGILILGLISGCSLTEPLQLEHTPTKAKDKPIYLGELKFNAKKPTGLLAVKDKLYITFAGDENVGVYSLTGQLIKEFPAKIKGLQGYPLNLAEFNGQLIITDYVNGTIGFFSLEGLAIDGFWETADKQRLKPVGVAVYDNIFYVSDANLKGFLAIAKDGEVINIVKPKAKAAMSFPSGISITDDGRALVADSKGHRVEVFNCAGWYAYDFDKGKGKELIADPQGIVIDGLNRVHVVDKKANKIFVYDNFGRFKFTYGQELKGPTGITVDRKNRLIYLANTGNKSVSLWGY